MHARKSRSNAAGFSLIELMIALSVTLVMAVIASTLLAQSLKVRSRENQRTEALADVQRALNVMSREIALCGLGYPTGYNGIVAADSTASSIRIRANLDSYPGNPIGTPVDSDVADANEDIKYSLYVDNANGRSFLVRYDVVTATMSVLANRIDALEFSYLDSAGAPTTAANAARVRVSVTVTLPQVGQRGDPGYQPPSQTQLVSEVTLRNTVLATY